MIRNAMFGLSLFALSAGSAIAAPAHHHVSKPRVVAEASAPTADTAAPAGEKADKPEKKAKKGKGTKKDKSADAAKTEGAKEMKAAPSPAK